MGAIESVSLPYSLKHPVSDTFPDRNSGNPEVEGSTVHFEPFKPVYKRIHGPDNTPFIQTIIDFPVRRDRNSLKTTRFDASALENSVRQYSDFRDDVSEIRVQLRKAQFGCFAAINIKISAFETIILMYFVQENFCEAVVVLSNKRT
jgi:hypothetical protein